MEDGDANSINTELVQRFLDTSFVHGTYIFNASPSGGGWSLEYQVKIVYSN